LVTFNSILIVIVIDLVAAAVAAAACILVGSINIIKQNQF
jgi:hypothetical protein